MQTAGMQLKNMVKNYVYKIKFIIAKRNTKDQRENNKICSKSTMKHIIKFY